MSVMWMFERVKDAAGIHFQTFKKDKAESGAELPDDEDLDVSGWTPPPSMMREWARAV